jgi:hypothetical protein
MVAKSYQGMEIVAEPYDVNGRMYVKVKNEKTGTVRQVRWYTDSEYKKMYPDAKIDHSNDPYWKSQKEVLGFTKGYITIFKGDTYEYKEWFKEIGAVYRKFWGWGLASDIELPAELPVGITPIKLEWSQVGADDEVLKNDDAVKAVIDSLMYEKSSSKFVGSIGERIEVELQVVRAISLDGYYGPSTMHIMEDADKNVFVWTTASKCWSEGSSHLVRGTVKDHKTYKNTDQTILTRCSEVKKG